MVLNIFPYISHRADFPKIIIIQSKNQKVTISYNISEEQSNYGHTPNTFNKARVPPACVTQAPAPAETPAPTCTTAPLPTPKWRSATW